MQEIVGGSGQLNVLMSEISTTTREQEKGINQITLALSDLESATHSNVLMVEALSASSDVLKAQVIELQTKTDKFRLSQPSYSEHTLSRAHVSSFFDHHQARPGLVIPFGKRLLLRHFFSHVPVILFAQ